MEETGDNSVLISANDPMLGTLPGSNLISKTIGPSNSSRADPFEPTEGFQKSRESGHGENSSLASMIDPMINVLPKCEISSSTIVSDMQQINDGYDSKHEAKYESTSTMRNAPVGIVNLDCLFKIFSHLTD